MYKKISFSKSFLLVWVAILSLGFTTVSFYDFNPKLLFVEITEERGEDGNDVDEEDGDVKDSFNKLIHLNSIPLNYGFRTLRSVFCNRIYATSTGYMLDLIKPPLN